MRIKAHQIEEVAVAGSSLLLSGTDIGAIRDCAALCRKKIFPGENAALFLGEDIAKDPDSLTEKIESNSLFEDNKFIHIIQINETQGKVVEKALKKNTSCFILIEGGNFSAKSTFRKGFERAAEKLHYLAFYPPIDKKSWIRKEANALKLLLTEGATELLVQYFSPNTALNRENLLKLSIMFGERKISQQDARQVLQDHSLTALWDVYEACILGEKPNLDQAMDSYTPLGLIRGMSRHTQSILSERRTGKSVSNTLFLHRKSLARQKSAEETHLLRVLALSISGEAISKNGRHDQSRICRNLSAQITSRNK